MWLDRFSKRILRTLADEMNRAKFDWKIKRQRAQLRGKLSGYIWRRRFDTLIIKPGHIYWAVHPEEAEERARAEAAAAALADYSDY